jgi:hypothetical protein
MWRRCPAMHFATVIYPSVTQLVHPFTRNSTIAAPPVFGCAAASAVQRAAQAAGLLIAILISGCKITGPSWCFEMEYGDCPSRSVPSPVHGVVGFPDSLVSTDPTNQIGILTVGDSVVLRYVTFLPTTYAAACASQELVHDSLRWGVTDSSIATVRGSKAGIGVLHARQVGRVQLLTTSSLSPTWPPRYWVGGAIACPSGRAILTIEIVAGPRSGPAPGAIVDSSLPRRTADRRAQ